MMRHRAILTGTFHRATYYNKPLPRMKVQPLHVSGMINKRIRARERRRDQHWVLMGLMKDVEAEVRFERALKRNAARFGQEFESVFQHMDWREYSAVVAGIGVVAEFSLSIQVSISTYRSRDSTSVSNGRKLVYMPRTPTN